MSVRIFGTHDEATIAQIERCVAAGGERGVLCADGHKGYAQPIGGVVAYRDRISISGVGFDIACGNLAIRTDAKAQDVVPKIDAVMDDVVSDISFGIGRHNTQRIEHELFDDPLWDEQPFKSSSRWRKPSSERSEAATTMSMSSSMRTTRSGWVCISAHAVLATRRRRTFLKKAGGKDGMDVDPAVVSESDPVGQAYIAGMKLAGTLCLRGS